MNALLYRSARGATQRNTVTGQASIWNMDGNTRIAGGGAIANAPGTVWKAVGSGDFFGNGLSDILWQNTNGQVSIWEMSGTTPIDQEPVSFNPGPDWKTIGTGDYNGDGFSDILFQSTTSGQAAIWDMNGITPISQLLIRDQSHFEGD